MNILVFIIFGILAFRISKGVSRETAIFLEYRQSTALQELVFLFPVGPVALAIGAFVGSPSAFLFAVACYLPALIMAYRIKGVFEKSGTDKVYGAMEVVSGAYATAIGGLVYVSLNFIYSLAMGIIFG